MGHRDIQTTMIYADYAPSAHEGEMVERAFSRSDRQGPGASEGVRSPTAGGRRRSGVFTAWLAVVDVAGGVDVRVDGAR